MDLDLQTSVEFDPVNVIATERALEHFAGHSCEHPMIAMLGIDQDFLVGFKDIAHSSHNYT